MLFAFFAVNIVACLFSSSIVNRAFFTQLIYVVHLFSASVTALFTSAPFFITDELLWISRNIILLLTNWRFRIFILRWWRFSWFSVNYSYFTWKWYIGSYSWSILFFCINFWHLFLRFVNWNNIWSCAPTVCYLYHSFICKNKIIESIIKILICK